jgi:hypothetical protein
MKKLKHSHIILNALRTAILFVTGFIAYEILIELEKLWNLEHPNNEIYNFHKRKLYKFFIVFMIDLVLLYFLFFLTGEHF